MCSLSFRLSSSSITSVRICLATYGSLPYFVVMGDVRKSLGIGLCVYSSERLIVSPPPIPN